MNDAGNGRPTFVADRVVTFFSRVAELRFARSKLRCNRITAIGRVDQLRHIFRDSDGEFLCDFSDLLQASRFHQSRRDEIFDAEDPGPWHQPTISRS